MEKREIAQGTRSSGGNKQMRLPPTIAINMQQQQPQ